MLTVSHIRLKKKSGKGYWIARVSVVDECGDPVFSCYALEDSYRCPPVGTWLLKLEYSPKFKRMLYELKGIPGRSEIKYHVGNTLADTDGCPLLGAHFINATVSGSRLALDKFMRSMEETGETFVDISVQ